MWFVSMCALLAPAAEPLRVDGVATVADLDGMVVVCLEPTAQMSLRSRPADAPWPGISDDTAVIIVNGGYVDGDRVAKGWRVLAGVETTARSDDPVQSGVAWIDDAARLHLDWLRNAPGAPREALQAGPFLIDPGGIFGIRATEGPLARRSAIAVTTDGVRVFAVHREAVTMHAFASALHRATEALGLRPLHAALNLDGGPAAGIQVRGHPEWSLAATGPIADVWVVGRTQP